MGLLSVRHGLLLGIVAFYSLAGVSYCRNAVENREVYIVHTSRRETGVSARSHHLSLLAPALGQERAKESLIYSYKHVNAFAVKLTSVESTIVQVIEGILAIFSSGVVHPHTTRSWDFLGLPKASRQNLDHGSNDVVVGIIDTGIWPESRSFQSPERAPPKKWKGVCTNLTCSGKIIGARFYNSRGIYTEREERNARDFHGHGTHVASTMAGNEVGNASLHGLASGTARGAVPSARIAAYKVCWDFGCSDEDVLAAFDDAIEDGVDVISISLGTDAPRDYYVDPIAIGAFHAVKHGILTCTSAGNSGPLLGSVVNTAPWLLSVAASTIDRQFQNKLVLRDNRTITGSAVNTFSTEEQFYPVLDFDANLGRCGPSDLDHKVVDGKIVICDGGIGGLDPVAPGARGVIVLSDALSEMTTSFPLPATVVGSSGKSHLSDLFAKRNGNPIFANIHKSQDAQLPDAPRIASFSSRGPSIFLPDVLKPDISAPGVGILAAWSPKGSLSSYSNDKRRADYNILSGTSMACPHITGVAAYIKSHHPNWSPAAIQSALVTTATSMDESAHPDLELAYGAGQVNPQRALHPGLIYEVKPEDYDFSLCKNGYNTAKLRVLTGDNSTCSNSTEMGTGKHVNYPSMLHYERNAVPDTIQFRRTVTNVGLPNSTYKAIVKPHPMANVTVTPSTLSFESLYQRKSFVVTVRTAKGNPANGTVRVVSTSLTWDDGIHRVRSPVVLVGAAL